MAHVRRTIKLIVLSVLAVIGTALMAEAMLRITNAPIPSFFQGIYVFPCYRSTNNTWLALKLNARCVLHSNQGAFPDSVITTNDFGLRNGPITTPKPEGTTRIVFVGDSFTFGFGVKGTEAFPYMAGTSLQNAFPDKHIEAINAGLPVAGAGRYFIRFNDAPYVKDADIVVVGLFMYNDIMDVETKPKWTDTNGDSLPDKITSTQAHIDFAGNLVSNYQPWFLNFPLLHDSKLLSLLSFEWEQLPFGGQKTVAPLIPDTLCIYQSDCHKYDTVVNQKKQLFLSMMRIAEDRKQKILFVMIPAEFQVYDSTRLKYNIPIALSPEEKRRPDEEFAVFFRQNNIPYLDLLPILSAWNGPHPYFSKDEHFNSVGHRITADAVVPVLEKLISGTAATSSAAMHE